MRNVLNCTLHYLRCCSWRSSRKANNANLHLLCGWSYFEWCDFSANFRLANGFTALSDSAECRGFIWDRVLCKIDTFRCYNLLRSRKGLQRPLLNSQNQQKALKRGHSRVNRWSQKGVWGKLEAETRFQNFDYWPFPIRFASDNYRGKSHPPLSHQLLLQSAANGRERLRDRYSLEQYDSRLLLSYRLPTVVLRYQCDEA